MTNFIVNGSNPTNTTGWQQSGVTATGGVFVLGTPSYMEQEIAGSAIGTKPKSINVSFLFKLDGAFNPLDLLVKVLLKVEIFYVDGKSDFLIFPLRTDAYDATTLQPDGYSKVSADSKLTGTAEISMVRFSVFNDSQFTAYVNNLELGPSVSDSPYTDEINEGVTKWLFLTYVTLEADAWVGLGDGGTAPFIQSVLIADVQSSDTPLVGPVFWDDLRIAVMQQIDWGLVNMVETFDGYVNFICFKYKPVTTMFIQMKGV